MMEDKLTNFEAKVPYFITIIKSNYPVVIFPIEMSENSLPHDCNPGFLLKSSLNC